MERLKENIGYQNIVLCHNCGNSITYHVTEIKGVAEEKHIICPVCNQKLYTSLEKTK